VTAVGRELNFGDLNFKKKHDKLFNLFPKIRKHRNEGICETRAGASIASHMAEMWGNGENSCVYLYPPPGNQRNFYENEMK
jgi:hypothetical protein